MNHRANQWRLQQTELVMVPGEACYLIGMKASMNRGGKIPGLYAATKAV